MGSQFIPESFKQSGSVHLGLQTNANNNAPNVHKMKQPSMHQPQQKHYYQQQQQQQHQKQKINQQMMIDDDDSKQQQIHQPMDSAIAQPYSAPKVDNPFDKYLKNQVVKPIKFNRHSHAVIIIKVMNKYRIHSLIRNRNHRIFRIRLCQNSFAVFVVRLLDKIGLK